MFSERQKLIKEENPSILWSNPSNLDISLLTLEYVNPFILLLTSLQPLFGKNAKIYQNALNFALHVNWKVAAKNFGLLTKNRLMHWQIPGLKDSISGNFCLVCSNY